MSFYKVLFMGTFTLVNYYFIHPKTINMKKILLVIQLSFFLFSNSFSQNYQSETTSISSKGFAVVSGGAAFPVGVFGKRNVQLTPESGLAKTGYNVNINGGYQIHKNYGITGTVFYSRFKLDQTSVNNFLNKTTSTSLNNGTVDHWQYLGIVVGPMGTLPIGDNLFLDVKAMAGVAHANMPVVKIDLAGFPEPVNLTKEHWSDVFTWQVGTNLRYNFAKNLCFFTNVDYNFMKPSWTTDTEDVIQKMGVIDLNVGLGVTF